MESVIETLFEKSKIASVGIGMYHPTKSIVASRHSTLYNILYTNRGPCFGKSLKCLTRGNSTYFNAL